MANPFFVAPPDTGGALQALMQGYDFADKRAKQAQQDAAYKEIGQTLQSGGAIDNNVLGKIMGLGPSGAPLLAAAAQLGKSDTTDEIKEYNLDMKQRQSRGLATMPFGDWKTALKVAGATKINNSVNTGENEYSKTINAGEAKRFLGFQDTARSAQDQLNSLQVMENAIKDPNFYSGPGAETFALPIKRAVAAFGGDPASAASMETFRAQANKAVLDSMGGSLGTGFSNADRDFVVSQVPGLPNTPEGNKALIDVNRKVAQRKIEISKMARQYAARNKGRIDAGFDDELAAWAEKNPLFPRPAAAPAAAPGVNRTRSGVQWSVE